MATVNAQQIPVHLDEQSKGQEGGELAGSIPVALKLFDEEFTVFPRTEQEVSDSLTPGWFGHFRGVPLDDGAESTATREPRTLKHIRNEDRLKDNSRPFATKPESREEKRERVALERQIRQSETTEKVNSRICLHKAEVPIKNLHPDLEGLTVLHISDIHFNEKWSRPVREMRALAAHLHREGHHVDIAAITGDVLTNTPRDFNESAVKALDRVAPGSIRVFVDGNHDYYGGGIQYVRRALETIGYQDVSNGVHEIEIGKAKLNIFGMSDHLEGQPEIPSCITTHVGIAKKEHDTNLLLVHNLDAVRENMPDIHDLVLSGHFHGGEIKGGELLMRLTGYSENLNKQIIGWKSLTERAMSHVSPGLARHWGQFGVKRPGVTLMTLRSAD